MNKILWLMLFLPGIATSQTKDDLSRQVQDSIWYCQECLRHYIGYAENVELHEALPLLRGAICAWQCKDSAHVDFFLQNAAARNWGECLSIWNFVQAYPEQFPEFVGVLRTPFVKRVRAAAKAAAIEQGIHFGLYMELDVMQRENQRQRTKFDSITEKLLPSSPEYRAAYQELKEADAMRLARIEEIIAKHGYPGKTLVGRLSDVAWLIIQYSTLEKQEQYLPLLTEAVNRSELDMSCLAMLTDRIRFYRDLPQVYGSQVVRDPATGKRSFHPIEDEVNVNKRRAEAGLIPLEDYARSFGFEWIPKH